MVAVVDLQAELLIEIGAAASARDFGGFVNKDARARVGEFDRRRKASKACADDMYMRRPHRSLLPSMASSIRSLLRLIGLRGGSKPRSIMALRMGS